MDKNLVQFGVTFPRDLLARVDNAKGKYLSRNKYILKILEEHLNENEKEKLLGAMVGAEHRAVVSENQSPKPC